MSLWPGALARLVSRRSRVRSSSPAHSYGRDLVMKKNRLIQEGQLSVTGKRMCTKYWLAKNSVDRLTDRARNDLKCVEGP